jgi:hypothetical protein
MKNLLTLTGGYPRNQNYLLNLQAELSLMGNSILGSISFDVILAGCAITDNHDGTVNITDGIVYIAGQVMRFDAANNVPADGSKAIITGTAILSTPLTFAPPDSPVKNVYSEIKGVIANSAGGPTRQLVVGVTMLTFEAYIDLRIAGSAVKGTIREFVFTGTDIVAFQAKFDDTGLGISPDMVDWAQMNGNNGTVDAQCRVFIGTGSMIDPITDEELVIASGDEGGEVTHVLSVPEMPSHSHTTEPIFDTGGGSGSNPVTGAPISRATRSLGVNATGGGNSHNNMQPYVGVFKIQKIR